MSQNHPVFDDFNQLLSQLDKGKLSIDKIYDYCYKQIKHHEQSINALTTKVDKNWIKTLKSQAKNLADTPLQGLPILVKDSIMTCDMTTTNGLERYQNFVPQYDAEIVSKIKSLGGLILAKTNLPAAAMDYQTFNSLFGLTNNPIDKTLTAGGSSGGSAAGIAMDYAPLALGSDLGGSLRIPASFCGVASFKPSLNRISIKGHMPPVIEKTWKRGKRNFELTVGPIAKDISALKYLDNLIINDINNIDLPDELNILITSRLGDIEPDKHIMKNFENLKNLNNKLENIQIEAKSVNMNFELIVNTHTSMVDYISGKATVLDENEMLNNQKEVRRQQHQIMKEYDAWILPVTPMVVPKHNLKHNRIFVGNKKINYWIAMGYYCWPFSVSGLPVVTASLTKKRLPIGMQIIGHYQKDAELLEVVNVFCKMLDSIN